MHKASPNHLVLAARQGDLEAVRQLTTTDESVASKLDDSGESALQLAAHQGNVEMCMILLGTGAVAVLNTGTPIEGLTPLTLAVSRGHTETVRLLLDHKADVEARDARFCTPLHHAAYKGHGLCADMLVKAGAQCSPPAPEGSEDPPESPLTIAAFMRHAQVAIALMEGGAQPSTIRSPQDKAWAEQLLRAHEQRKAQQEEEERKALQQQQQQLEQQGPGSPRSPSMKAGSRQPLRPTSALQGPLRSRPLTPVYVPPTPQELDEGEMFAYNSPEGGSALRGLGSSRGPAVWFQIHDEAIEVIPNDDQDEMLLDGSGKSPLYRAPTGPQASSTLPALSSTSSSKANGNGMGAGAGASGRAYSGRGSAAQGSSEDRILHLYPISYIGIMQGFLLDEEQRFVYYLDPLLQKWVLEAQQQGELRSRPFPFAPHFVGRWEGSKPGAGAGIAGASGYIKPIQDEWHCMLLENHGGPVKKSLRHNSPAAAWLSNRSGITADFAANGTDTKGVSLVVPLCAVLGVHEMSEVAQLNEQDLRTGFVDTQLLEPLLRALQALGMKQGPGGAGGTAATMKAASSRPSTANGPASPSLAASRPGTASRSGAVATSPAATRRPMTARPGTANVRRSGLRSSGGGAAASGNDAYDPQQQPAPEQMLVSLLQEHSLMKLLPLAAELRIVDEPSRWHHLVNAAPVWAENAISRFEQARLASLLQAMTLMQEVNVQRRLASLTQLVRVSVGAICLYEVTCRPRAPAGRGERLLGLVVEDVNNGERFKVRDLLDDEMVWAAPGQLTRVTASETMKYLRADLLPPSTCGPPVLPSTAFVGAPVQLAYHFWQRPTPPEGDASERDGAALQAGLDVRSARAVVGIMVEAGSPDGSSWRVRWPDGTVCLHATGADGRFELAHFHLHRAAGVPLSRAHIEGLLLGQNVGTLPVVRSPLWSRPTTDDEVPGSVGMALLEAGQTALTVVWGCSACPRDQLPMYSPDSQGLYQLCHGIMPATQLSMFTAKQGIPVEDERGRRGVLAEPVSLLPDGSPGIVWSVAWDNGGASTWVFGDGALTGADSSAGLRVSHTFHIEKQLDRVWLLNEVTMKHNPGCQQTVNCCGDRSGSCALGRASFWKGPTAHVVGAMAPADQPLLLGELVKLNHAVVDLQPGAEQGPMACFEKVDVPTLMRARREGHMLEPLPRDDIGVVVRDLGPGAWRGVLVRKYGGKAESFWYDETLLLPASQQDLAKQVNRQKSAGGNYAFPRTLQGVPVTDGNSAPGMLVQRAFREGAAMQNSDKAVTIGVLVKQPQPLVWTVRWPDGKVRDYKTGYRGQFQLCFAQSCLASGAPLMHCTVQEMAALNRRVAVTDGMFCMHSPCTPGMVRWVNDKDTQLGLPSGEARLLEAAGLVVTTMGERLFAGGPLQLFELAHAIVPGAPLTMFTAKKGLRVELHTEGVKDDDPQAPKPDDASDAPSTSVRAHAKPKTGMLYAPVRLVTTSIRKSGNSKPKVDADRSQDPTNKSAITGNFRTPNGRIISAEQLCASQERTPVWLYGQYKTRNGTMMTGPELCAALDRMHHAKDKKKDQQQASTAEQDLETMIQEMYQTRTISEGDEGRLVQVQRVVMGDKELWVPVDQRPRDPYGTGMSTGGSQAEVGAEAQAGADGGGAAALPREMVDACKVVWQVVWDDGSSGEFVVGTEPSHSCLRVAGSTEGLDPAPLQLYDPEHFVRMLEPVLLIDTGSRHRNRHLARLADALQSALQWHNQLLRELVNVWWCSCPLLAPSVMFRPQVELLQCQPDFVSLFIQGRTTPLASWQTVEHDEDGQIIDRIDAPADADLAQAVQRLIRTLGSRPRPTPGQAGPPSALHLLPSEDASCLLDGSYMTDGSGRTVEAPEDLAKLLAEVNSAAARLRAGLASANDTYDDEATLYLNVGCTLEPSMGVPQQQAAAAAAAAASVSSGAGAGGGSGSGDESMVTRVTTLDGEVLQPAAGRTASRRSNPDSEQAGGNSLMLTIVRQPMGEQQELPDIHNVMPVGPGQMLTMGCAAQLRRGLQGIQRCLGALAGSAYPINSTMGSWGGHGKRGLLLVGNAPVLWLEAVELEAITGCLPRDLPLARCRAAVNVHLFDMWRTCARSFVEGSGSADISRCLVKLLEVVQQKAQAAVAADAAVRWADASINTGSDINAKMNSLHTFFAGEVQTFAANTTQEMLGDISKALMALAFVHEAARTAHESACHAVVSSQLMTEQDDLDALAQARDHATAAIEACATNTRNAFPNMADAAVTAAEHVVQDMYTTLQAADTALARALVERKAASEAAAACEKESKEVLSAAETVKAKYDAVAGKLKDLAQAHNQLKAEQEALATSSAAVVRYTAVWREKQTRCTIKGQARLLRERLELMLEARAAADKLSQQLREIAHGTDGSTSQGALDALAQRVEELLRWAADFEQEVSGFTLDLELKRALGVVKSKVEAVVESLKRLLAGGVQAGVGATDDAETLELLKQVAELGVQAADRVGADEVKRANETVLQAVESAARGGAAPGGGGSGPGASTGVLGDLEPALEAATYFGGCLQATITAWAAFSMQLAREAAKDTSLSDVTARLSEELAEEVSRQKQMSQVGVDMVQRQAMEQQGMELSVATVMAAADKEERAARKHLDEAEAAAHGSEENVRRIASVVEKLLAEVGAAVHEAERADESAAKMRGSVGEQVQKASELAVAAETALWRARRMAPASMHPDFKVPPGEPKEATHVARAQAAVLACVHALEVLDMMRKNIPPALRSAEAAERMLTTCQARVAAAATRAAAEWARTAALCCEVQLADQDWYERVMSYLSAAEKREHKDQAQLAKLAEAKEEAKENIRAQLEVLAAVYSQGQEASASGQEGLPDELARAEVLVNGKLANEPAAEAEEVGAPAADDNSSSVLPVWKVKAVKVNEVALFLDEESSRLYQLGGPWPLLRGTWDGQAVTPPPASPAVQMFTALDAHLKTNRVRFKELFDRFDSGLKGYLSYEDLRALLSSLRPVSEADLKYFDAIMDANQDSCLSMQEFLEMAQLALLRMQGRNSPEAEQALASVAGFLRREQAAIAELFASFDSDNDGKLAPKEVALMFRNALPDLTPRELRFILTHLFEADLGQEEGLVSLRGLLVALGGVDAEVIPETQQEGAASGAAAKAAAAPADNQALVREFEDVAQAFNNDTAASYSNVVEALCQLDVSSAVSVHHLLPAPRPLRGPPLDEACTAASAHLPAAVQTYLSTRPQVDPTVDLSMEDTALLRVLQSAFTLLDQVARVSSEAAEQLATGPHGGGSGATPGAKATGGPPRLDASMRNGEGSESGKGEARRDPYAAPQAVLLYNGQVTQSAEALASLAAVCMAASQQHPSELGQKLEAVSKPAKAAGNAAKRSQIAVTRALGEAVKQLGPPAFTSGVMATVLAQLAVGEEGLGKALKWTQQAAEAFKGKVVPDMDAALAAAEAVPPKQPKPEGDEGEAAPPDPAQEAAEQQRLQVLMKQLKLEQQEKERAIMAFVARVAVEVAAAACDAGGKLDLSSYMTPNEDEVTSNFVAASSLIDAATQLAASGSQAPRSAGAGAAAVDGGQAGPRNMHELAMESVDETLVKLCQAETIIKVANDSLRLVGGADVKKLLADLDDCLRSYSNVPKMQASLLEKLASSCEESVMDGPPVISEQHHAQLVKLIAYEQVVVASITVAERVLDAARLVTVSITTEENLTGAKRDLTVSQQKLGRLLAMPGAPMHPSAHDQSAEGHHDEQTQTQQGLAGELSVKLQVLLSGPRPEAAQRLSDSAPASPAARSTASAPAASEGAGNAQRSWQLLVGFAPALEEALPLTKHLEQHEPDHPPPAELVAAAPAHAEASRLLLAEQQRVIQGDCAPELTDRLKPVQSVLSRPAVARLLQPFATLMDACNRAMTAVAAAEMCQPDDGLLLSHALLGAPDISHQAAATNFDQFRRWDHEVAIMRSTARLVLFGFLKAQAMAASQLSEVQLQPLPQAPPLPAGEYKL